MANSIGTAWIQIKPSMAGISKDIEKELGGVGAPAGKQISNGIISGMSYLGGKIGDFITKGIKVASVAAGVLITKNIGGAFDRIDTLANYPKVMKNLGYETEEVANSMKELEKNVKGLPTGLSDIVTNAQQLAVISDSLDEATKTAIAFNNAALASGQGQVAANQSFVQFTQILAKGKPDMQDWKSLQQTMPGQLSQVAKQLGIASGSTQELYSKMQDGIISTEDFRDAFISLNENGIDGFAGFKEQAFDATDGIKTSLTNMEIAIQRGIEKTVEAIGKDNLTGAIESMGNAFETAGEVVGKVIDFFKEHPTIFNALAIAVGVVTVGLVALNIVMGILAMNPIVLIISAIIIGLGVLIGIIVMIVQHAEDIGAAISWLFAETAKIIDGVKDKIHEVFGKIVGWIQDNVTGPISGFFTGVWDGIVNGVNRAIDSVRNTFNSVKNWISSNIINPIAGFFSGLWNGVKIGVSGLSESIRSIFDTIVGVIKAPINGIIGGINGVLRSINRLKIPDWVPGLGGKSPNFPTIPALYHGGIITSPTIALVGDNPAGEAVIPLDELDRIGGGKPQIVNNIGDVHIASDYDAERLLEVMGIKQDLYAKGVV